MMTKIPDLAYEIEGETINLEQDMGFGEVDRIFLHALHVRMLATELGLLKGDEDAWRRVDTLQRRLRVLVDRIDRLDDLIRAAAEKGREDLEAESVYAYATWELAREWAKDLDLPEAAPETELKPTANPEETQRVSAGAQGNLLEAQQ